jgi:hypothetical protein
MRIFISLTIAFLLSPIASFAEIILVNLIPTMNHHSNEVRKIVFY